MVRSSRAGRRSRCRLDGNFSYDSKTINAPTPDEHRNGRCAAHRTSRTSIVRVEHALKAKQPCSSKCSAMTIKRDNLGVGDFDLPSRAYTSETADTVVRCALNGLVAPKVANELQGPLSSEHDNDRSSASGDPAVIVSGAFIDRRRRQQQQPNGATTLEVDDNIDFSFARSTRCARGCWRERLVRHDRPAELQRDVHLRRPRTRTTSACRTRTSSGSAERRSTSRSTSSGSTSRTTGRSRTSALAQPRRASGAPEHLGDYGSISRRASASPGRRQQVDRARRLGRLQRLVRRVGVPADAARERRQPAGRRRSASRAIRIRTAA